MDLPPPPSERTPRLFLTPQIGKRKDGLCPSLHYHQSSTRQALERPGELSKVYQTNSALLLQIKKKDNIPKEVMELQSLVEAIYVTLKNAVKHREGVTDVRFKAEGCIWIIEFEDDIASEQFRIEVILEAQEGMGMTIYYIDSRLIPKIEIDPNPLAPSPSGFNVAKEVYDKITLFVRKSIVRFEFPEFPEGCKGRPFREVYQLNARLKAGSFATVCRGTHRATGYKVAIKCVLRKDLPISDDAAIYDEVAILSSLHHDHIVPIIDFFEERDCYFIIMELMSGGDLFDRIGEKKSYNEADARDLVVKMLKAVAYCHQRKIAHCDMKPKNLLLISEEDDSFIKLADFGFAARVHKPKSLTKQCGTPFFVAPEILCRRPYDQQADMWSVGCIVFLLLSGNLPFMGRSQKELFRKIVAGKYEFKESEWQDVSEDAKDLVSKLLVLNPDYRLTARRALMHPWLKLSKDHLSMIALQGTSQRLKNFNAKMKLRSAMIAVDYVSAIKQMSSRNLLKSNGASSGNAGASGLPRARRVKSSSKSSRNLSERAKKTSSTAAGYSRMEV